MAVLLNVYLSRAPVSKSLGRFTLRSATGASSAQDTLRYTFDYCFQSWLVQLHGRLLVGCCLPLSHCDERNGLDTIKE